MSTGTVPLRWVYVPGSEADVKRLEEAYETVGFDVYVYRDCTTQVSICAWVWSWCEETEGSLWDSRVRCVYLQGLYHTGEYMCLGLRLMWRDWRKLMRQWGSMSMSTGTVPHRWVSVPGSEADVKRLEEAYETVGFDVYIYRDCTTTQVSICAWVSGWCEETEGSLWDSRVRCLCLQGLYHHTGEYMYLVSASVRMHVFMSLPGLLWQQHSEQEWIRVRCVPFAVVTVWGCLSRKGMSDHRGVCPGGVCLVVSAWGCLPGGGCLVRGGCLPRGCLPGGVCAQRGVCLVGCLPRGISAQGVFAKGMSAQRGEDLPCGQNDSCIWKHYLSATIVADGNGMHCNTWLEVN